MSLGNVILSLDKQNSQLLRRDQNTTLGGGRMKEVTLKPTLVSDGMWSVRWSGRRLRKRRPAGRAPKKMEYVQLTYN